MARDLAVIAARLKLYLVNGSAITGVKVLSAGHSNETYSVEGLDLILRMAPSGAPLIESAFGVRQQFDIFAVIGRLPGAPPVPRLHHMEQDTDVLGSPFFLMERAQGIPWGDWGAPDWASSRSVASREDITRQALEAVAALHRQKPQDVFGPIKSSRQELARWRESVAHIDVDADLRATFTLLDTTVPEPAPPAPCHGDPKLANMLWLDGRLTALLDWELAFNGDPRWDLAWLLTSFDSPHHPGLPGMDLPGLWQRERIIAEWERSTGRSSKCLQWFEAAVYAKVGAIVGYGYALTTRGLSNDARFATWKDVAREYAQRALQLARIDQAATPG